MAQLTVQTVIRAGINLNSLAVAAASGGDKWAGTGKEMLWIANGAAAAITLTLVYQALVDGQAVTNRTVIIPASLVNGMLVGPFPVNWYNDSTGNVNITYSAVTSVTVCPFILGN